DQAALAQRAHGERAAAEENALQAHRARIAAEEDARAHAELAREAAAERTAAEERTRQVLDEAAAAATRHREELEAAVTARLEAERAVAAQVAARLEAEQAAEQRAVDRGAVEAVVRHHTEVAEEVIQERIAAEQRAGELADELATARAQLLDEAGGTRPTPRQLEPEPERGFFPFGDDGPAQADDQPYDDLDGTDGTRMFDAPGPPAARMLVLLVVAGLAAIGLGYSLLSGHALGTVGIISLLALAAAVFGATRLRTRDAQIGIHGGVVTLAIDGSHHRFDLSDPGSEVEMLGTPDHKDWQVLFKRRTLRPLVVDGRMVDSVAFTSALRKWRPDL
ncbi:MAG: hypothetical protein JWN36_2845, partial [Microbacteriaceae bacterium]|nr:hypothetical protein [Microbacteriaceae bacterium]